MARVILRAVLRMRPSWKIGEVWRETLADLLEFWKSCWVTHQQNLHLVGGSCIGCVGRTYAGNQSKANISSADRAGRKHRPRQHRDFVLGTMFTVGNYVNSRGLDGLPGAEALLCHTWLHVGEQDRRKDSTA